jgi:MYXO-CTERM domain-containing protein
MGALLLASSPASAGEQWESEDPSRIVLTRDQVPTAADENVSNVIFLNRCKGGCTIYPGSRNDARSNSSTIVDSMVTISEFAHGDAVWNEIVQCVQELYAPYNVVVTDVDPGENTLHSEAIVAGVSSEIGRDVGGIAPGGVGCSPINNAITFTFANQYSPNSAMFVCSVVGQETAHAFGLDHVFDCGSPMTYLGPSCGRQWFRNENLPCGEWAERPCECTGLTQNDHVILRSVFGDGTAPPPPDASLSAPADGTEVTAGFLISATASDPRQVFEVDFYINGWRYLTMPGHEYQNRTQPYNFVAPGDLPQGVQNIEVRVRNDLGSESVLTAQVTMGPPCANADACLQGQSCESGACTWPAPTQAMGETCTIDQECTTELCASNGSNAVCTETCFVGVNDFCPDGFGCVDTGGGQGVCWPSEGSGGDDTGSCCSVGDTQSQRGQLALALLVGMLLFARRRRARS